MTLGPRHSAYQLLAPTPRAPIGGSDGGVIRADRAGPRAPGPARPAHDVGSPGAPSHGVTPPVGHGVFAPVAPAQGLVAPGAPVNGGAAPATSSNGVASGNGVASTSGAAPPLAPVDEADEQETAPRLALAEPPAKGRRIAPMTVIRIVVTFGAFALIAHKIGFRAVLHALGASNPALLAAGYAVAVITILITVRQWHGLSNANGVKCSYWRCLHIELGGDVFDAALPSSIGGDVIRAASLPDSPDQRVPAAASVVLRRLCNFPGMIVLTAVGLVATVEVGYAGRIRPYALCVVVGGLCLVACAMSPALGRMSQWGLLKRGPGVAVAKLLATLHEFRGQRRDLLQATLRGVVFWIFVVASQSLFILAVGIHVSLAYSALVVTTATAVTMVPISLGGYGLREGAFAAFLAAGGHATGAQGAAVGICITVQTLALGVIGIPFYLTIKNRRRQPVALAPAPELEVDVA